MADESIEIEPLGNSRNNSLIFSNASLPNFGPKISATSEDALEISALKHVKLLDEEDSFNMEHKAETKNDESDTGISSPAEEVTEHKVESIATTTVPTVPNKRSGVKISLHDLIKAIPVETSSDEDVDQDQEVEDKDQANLKVTIKNETEGTKKSGFWQQLVNRRKRNKVVDNSDRRPESGERGFKSAKQIRAMRKKVSLNSKGKKRTSQEDLAIAIIEGQMQRVEDIVEAYTILHQSEGLRMVMGFRYDIDSRTYAITPIEKPLADQVAYVSPKGIATDIFFGLSATHISCAFDQEQILAYFMKYGTNVAKVTSPSGQSLLHTCAWFGTAAPMSVLLSQGVNTWSENARLQHPIHLAAMQGHISCLKLLISAGADLECKDNSGNTPLHLAVLSGHYDCAQELINYDVDVNQVNIMNGSALHYASTIEMVNLLVSNGADLELEMEDPPESGMKRSAFKLLLEKMPEGCNEIFTKYLLSNGQSQGSMAYEVSLDLELFMRNQDELEMLTDIVAVDQRDLLKHPVCESFLHMKWLLVKNQFYFYLAFYTLFLLSVTGLVLIDFSPIFNDMDQDLKDYLKITFAVATLISVMILLLKNCFLMCYSYKVYMSTWQNFYEILTILVIIMYLGFTEFNFQPEALIHLGSYSLFLAWFNFTLLMGKLPAGGIYINMVVAISKDFLRFLLLYASTLIAFGLSFHILSSHKAHFANPLTSILNVLTMMVGEISFIDTFTSKEISYHGTTEIMFVLFLLLGSITIMNLLVGLAISNINNQFQSAGVFRLKMTVILVKMISDATDFFHRICPCFFSRRLLVPFLLRKRLNIKEEDLKIYIYPNLSQTKVFVKDGQGNKIATGFSLPTWILGNAHKILNEEKNSSAVQLAAEKRKQEERLNRLSMEVKSIKKDVGLIKSEMQTVANYIRVNRKSTARTEDLRM